MSRGELIIEDNQVKQGSASQSNGWADEFQTQYNANANSWADQFAHEEVITERWVYCMLNEDSIFPCQSFFFTNHWCIMALYSLRLLSFCAYEHVRD